MKRLALFLIAPLSAVAQNTTQLSDADAALPRLKNDTIRVSKLLETSKSYMDNDSVKGFSYARKALDESRKIEWKDGIAKSYHLIGVNYMINSQYDKAINMYMKALAAGGNQHTISKIYLSLSSSYINKSQYPQALDILFKALKIREESGDKNGTARVMVNVGTAYNLMLEYRKALTFLNRALKIFEETGNKQDLPVLLRTIGVSHNALGESRQSLPYFHSAFDHAKSLGRKDMQTALLSDIALVYFDLEQYDKAIEYSKASLESETGKISDRMNEAFSYGVIGDSYIGLAEKGFEKKSNLDSAVANLGKAIKIHRELESWRSLLDDYTSLTTAKKMQGDFEEALTASELAAAFRDSIYNSENRETVKNLEDKRAIELRDKELKINALELEAKEKQKWFLIAGLVLLTTIGALLFFQSRSRKNHNEKLIALNRELDKANKVRAQFFSILNHDLRSPVYNLIHALQLQKDSPELLDDEMRQRIEAKNMAAAENLLQSMEDLLAWSKSQMEVFKPEFENVKLIDLFADVQRHFSGFTRVRFVVDLEDRDQAINTDRNYLMTILRNIVGNAIKAMEETPEPTITIKAREQHGSRYIWVSDNGLGANEKAFRALYDSNETLGIRSGLGLHIIRDMAAAIGCKVLVDSTETGTRFRLVFG